MPVALLVDRHPDRLRATARASVAANGARKWWERVVLTDRTVMTYLTWLPPFCRKMFSSSTKQQTTGLWMWRMEYLHHEQRPLYFGEWF